MIYTDPQIQKYISEFIPKKYPMDSEARRKQRLCQLKKALDIINSINLPLTEIGFYQESIYAYGIKNSMGVGYLAHIISQINDLQKFFNPYRFIKIEQPNSHYKQQLIEAFQSSGKKIECDPLTVELLEEIRPRLLSTTYNFFFCTLWLGLRPSELLRTKSNKNSYSVEVINETRVLKIYQNKLHQLKKADRWKYIPILEPQQKQALEILEAQAFTRPSNSTIQGKALTDRNIHIGRYSGRKGFVPLMLKKGYRLEDLSAILGHRNIAMSLKHYTDNEAVQVARIQEMIK